MKDDWVSVKDGVKATCMVMFGCLLLCGVVTTQC